MSKIGIFLTILVALAFGGIYAGLGDAPSTVQQGNIDVRKPTFFNIMLRNPDIFSDIPEDEDITIFAPSDAAFGQLNQDVLDNIMKPEHEVQLKKIMNAHVVRGEYYTKDLKDGMKLKSEEGKELNVTVEDGIVKVNGAELIESDSMIRRGAMHVIDRVLIPPDVSLDDLKQ